jgi:hypothetical protein
MFGVHYDDLAGAPIACPEEHARAEIDGCEVKVPRVVTQIQSGAGGNFENPALGRFQQARAKAAEYEGLQRRSAEVVPPRCTIPFPLKLQQ